MRNLFYTMGLACLLIACNKEEPAPIPPKPAEPITIKVEQLVGTWIYDNVASDVTEVFKFTDGGTFCFTDDMEDILTETYAKGSFQMGTDGKVSGGCAGKALNLSFFKMTDYSFTVKDNNTGESRTYSKLVGETVKIGYQESDVPQYTYWVEGEISSYKSSNEKTATVDATSGEITAMSEGVTAIYVVSAKGTAAILVKAEGLIPDYADAIGCYREEIKSIYGEEPYEDFETLLSYRDEVKSVQFDFNKRTKRVNGVVVKYGNNKGFSNKQLVDYLKTKYYLHEEEDDEKLFYDHADYKEKAMVTITWDNEKELEFLAINRDLFEDFSIAIGKTRNEIENDYGEELILQRENGAELEYRIGEDLLGFAGVDKIKTVKFTFANDVVVSVLVRLKNLTTEAITAYLEERYGESIGHDTDATYFYDAVSNIDIAYRAAYDEIEYYTPN